MFNPAITIYNEVNEYIKQNGTVKEKSNTNERKSLMKRKQSNQNSSTQVREPIQEVVDIVMKIRENNPKYKGNENA